MAPTNFRYEPLASEDSFRLVRLLDAQQPGEIEIELFEAIIERHADDESPSASLDFEAISYAWGEDSADIVISCNGQSLAITPVVASILQALRERDSIRTLWIDAICIDQSSVEEKNVQVPRMNFIYMEAKTVWIWLGNGSCESDVAFDFLSRLSEIFHSRYPIMFDFQLFGKKEMHDIYIEFTENVRKQRGFYDPVDTNFIFDILNLPWFHRTWTLQEVLLAKCAVLLHGSKTLPWSHFVRCLDVLQSYEREQHDILSNPATYYQEIMWHKLTSVDDFRISDALRAVRRRLSRDPKDKVYGIYGLLARKNGQMLPNVDYRKSVQDNYTETAKAAMEYCGLRSVLYQTHLPPLIPGMPSWVPDWSNNAFIQPFDYDFFDIPDKSQSMALPYFIDCNKLKISCQIGNEIKQIAHSTSAAGPDFRVGYKIAMSTAGPEEHRKRVAGIIELVRTLQVWAELGSVDQSSFERFLLDILIQTWSWNYSSEVSEAQTKSCIKRCIALLGAKIGGGDLDLRTLVKSAKSKNRDLYDSLTRHYVGMVGCSNNVADWPDELVIRMLLKLDSKEVADVQHDIALLTYQRTLFRTTNGLFGLGPRWSLPGDVSALIPGFEVPFILRKADNHFKIIGPAVLGPSFINPEAGIWRAIGPRWDAFPVEEIIVV